jgi:hypothetical protein
MRKLYSNSLSFKLKPNLHTFTTEFTFKIAWDIIEIYLMCKFNPNLTRNDSTYMSFYDKDLSIFNVTKRCRMYLTTFFSSSSSLDFSYIYTYDLSKVQISKNYEKIILKFVVLSLLLLDREQFCPTAIAMRADARIDWRTSSPFMSVKNPLGLVLYCYLNMPTINKTYLILS